MAVGEETLIDAPVTPAPVFAYRALRAVFWGEEETPQRVLEETVDDKPQQVRHSSQTQATGIEPTTQLTPSQKRKHSALSQVSPAKSILRTPGAHTPRRALLKDLNVTFKDIRKSMSPELAQKAPLLPISVNAVAKDQKENRPLVNMPKIMLSKNTPHGSKIEICTDVHQTTKTQRTAGSPTKSITAKTAKVLRNQASTTAAAGPASTVVIATSDFDAEAYMRSTETEMKKLIKYGQKMREYAKRQDEENDKLRGMLDEMRAENKRLQKQLEESGNGKATTKHIQTRPGMESTTSGVKAEPSYQGLNRKVSRTQKIAEDHQLSPVSLDETAPQPVKRLSSVTHTVQQPPRDTKATLNPISTSITSHIPSNSNKPNHVSINIPPLPIESKHSSKPTSIQPRTESLILPLHSITNNTVASTTRMAPDRLAAARARVKKKAELRKVSNEVDGVESHDRQLTTRVDMRQAKENNREVSLVDWAGL